VYKFSYLLTYNKYLLHKTDLSAKLCVRVQQAPTYTVYVQYMLTLIQVRRVQSAGGHLQLATQRTQCWLADGLPESCSDGLGI